MSSTPITFAWVSNSVTIFVHWCATNHLLYKRHSSHYVRHTKHILIRTADVFKLMPGRLKFSLRPPHQREDRSNICEHLIHSAELRKNTENMIICWAIGVKFQLRSRCTVLFLRVYFFHFIFLCNANWSDYSFVTPSLLYNIKNRRHRHQQQPPRKISIELV